VGSQGYSCVGKITIIAGGGEDGKMSENPCQKLGPQSLLATHSNRRWHDQIAALRLSANFQSNSDIALLVLALPESPTPIRERELTAKTRSRSTWARIDLRKASEGTYTKRKRHN